jgi:hypothetical protein
MGSMLYADFLRKMHTFQLLEACRRRCSLWNVILLFDQKSRFRWLLFVRNSICIVDVDRRPRSAAPTRQFRDANFEKVGSSRILAILI